MNRSISRSMFLAAALGFSSLAFAATGTQTSNPPATTSSGPMQQGKWQGMHHRHGHHGDMRMLDKLNLSDTQRANIQQMTRESFEQARPEMQALRQKREALEAAMPGSSAYRTATDELATAEANAARQRVGREAALRARIYGVLSPEQRTQLASLRAERKAKMRQWRSEHPRHPSSDAPASADSSG
ncbi:MAG TPA: Spy/CpxP family protein refolding chaperone [Rhodanobacteraceae bacterium]|nr:Spy/CpxP family protein refolding chaperone [Rhodanobacteraceae bacterium]